MSCERSSGQRPRWLGRASEKGYGVPDRLLPGVVELSEVCDQVRLFGQPSIVLRVRDVLSTATRADRRCRGTWPPSASAPLQNRAAGICPVPSLRRSGPVRGSCARRPPARRQVDPGSRGWPLAESSGSGAGSTCVVRSVRRPLRCSRIACSPSSTSVAMSRSVMLYCLHGSGQAARSPGVGSSFTLLLYSVSK